jgi:hypothetical protein
MRRVHAPLAAALLQKGRFPLDYFSRHAFLGCFDTGANKLVPFATVLCQICGISRRNVLRGTLPIIRHKTRQKCISRLGGSF